MTGAAGFVGYHLSRRLLERGDEVVGIDNLNAYYSVELKEARLRMLHDYPRFRFERIDLADRQSMAQLFEGGRFARVAHLGAQAGVRYSLDHPHAYADSNLVGFLNVLEGCRHAHVEHLVYASSSSVYGGNTATPFSVHQVVDHPVSLYAATKKANELMAHTYSHLYRLPTTGLRFFTVYGPWGRPDMAYFSFANAIMAGTPIKLFNSGDMRRDFTYVDDVVEGLVRTIDRVAAPDPAWNGHDPDPAASSAPYRVYNIGNSDPVHLSRFLAVLEGHLGRKAMVEHLPMQPGDVPATFADVSDLERDVGFRPNTSIEDGLGRFVAWYLDYHGVRGGST